MAPLSITLSAPAKINLSLRLLGKRPDGYHEIETFMAPLTLADTVEIRYTRNATTNKVTLTCNDPSLPIGTENLCVQAAHSFQQATNIQGSIAITLFKKIPHGAGLGGGSSNAAAVLQGLNFLLKEPLTSAVLQEIATTLGSDVPFFLNRITHAHHPGSPHPAWCRGRGEQLIEAAPLPSWNLLLVKPPFRVSTAWAYHAWDKKQWPQENPVTVEGVTLFNDLEAPVFEKYLLLPTLKRWLRKRPEVITSWMSGSGSTMIALLKKNLTPQQQELLQQEIKRDVGEECVIILTNSL